MVSYDEAKTYELRCGRTVDGKECGGEIKSRGKDEKCRKRMNSWYCSKCGKAYYMDNYEFKDGVLRHKSELEE